MGRITAEEMQKRVNKISALRERNERLKYFLGIVEKTTLRVEARVFRYSESNGNERASLSVGDVVSRVFSESLWLTLIQKELEQNEAEIWKLEEVN